MSAFLLLVRDSTLHFLFAAADYSAPLGDLQGFENEWVEVEMRPPKGWCEPTSSTTSSTMSSPITIPNCDAIDESDVPPFLRDDINLTESLDDRTGENTTWKIDYTHIFHTNVAHVVLQYENIVNL